MIEKINSIALKLVNILQDSGIMESIDISFLQLFPQNCCEVVSNLFKFIIEDTFPDVKVDIVKGSDCEYIEHHFWCKIDNLLYDLTAHQFETVAGPIIGSTCNASYIEDKFIKLELNPEIDDPIVTDHQLKNFKQFFESRLIRSS